MKVNKEDLRWLTTVPASDINFKTRLRDANLVTMREALGDNGLSKTARKAIEIQIRRITK